MKKLGLKICVALALFLFVSFFVGCAKTGEGDIFRFEVRELSLTVGDSRNLKLVLGEQSEDTEICFIISEVGSDPFTSDASADLGVISLEKQSIHSGESIKVTADEEGSVYLTAYVKDNKNISDTIVVTVSKVKLTAMTAVPTKDELLINETAQFTVTIYPNTILDKSVTYKSSDENVGTISETGLFTALNVGTTLVTVTSNYDDTIVAVKEMTVLYNPTTEVSVTNEEVALEYLDEYQIEATALPNEYPLVANPELKYEVKASEEETAEVVTVSETGLVKAVGVGEAVVVITSVDGVSKELKFTVTYAQATGIVVKNGEEELENGDVLEVTTDTKKVTLSISVTPENAEQAYTVETTDTEGLVLTVDAKGVITIKGVGEAYITIISGELTFGIVVSVTEPAAEEAE